MKILEIIPQLSQGGAERFVIDLCNEMSTEHEVVLVVLHNVDNHGFFRKELSKRVHLISMNKRMGMDWRLFFRLAKLIRKEKPDVVHTHLRGIVYTFLSYISASKIKFIHTVHNDAKMEAGGGVSKWCRKLAFGLKRVHPVTISEESQRSFEKFYHLPSTLIYNGRPEYNFDTDISAVQQELEDIKTNKNAKMVVNIARIQPQKNQLSLAKAVDNLNKQGHAIELAIIGSKADKQIVSDIEALNSPYVHLLDVRTNPRDYMRAADAFCLSSIYEGMPITLIECFSVGAIPLCTPVGGIINMIQDGENGLLAKSPNQKDIENMLIHFLEQPIDGQKRIRQKSLDSFTKYDMATCYLNYMKLILK